MKNLPLKHKLLLSLSMLIIFFVICSMLFINLYFKYMFKTHFIHMGNDLAATVASHITNSVLIKDFVEIHDYFHTIMQNNPDVAYIFIEKSGDVILHTFSDGFPKNLLNAGHDKKTLDHLLIKTDEATYYDFSVPIFEGTGETLRLGMRGKIIQDLVNNSIKALLIGSLTAVLIILLFSIAVSKNLVTPLSLLTDSAAKIAAGDYTRKVAADNSDEIGKLAESFNSMIEAVRIREQELRETNEQLEIYGAKMYEFIQELNRTKDELVQSKQDVAVVQTAQAFLHHLRQPLTFLFVAIDTLLIEIKQGNLHEESATKKLHAVEVAAARLAELLKKFENLREYKTVEFSGNIKIVDIDKTVL